jgi:predicted HTH transcriptional regulator
MTTRVQKTSGKTKKLSQTKTRENKKTSRTSLQAYQQKKQHGTLTSDREKVKELVQKLGPISSKELQMWMNKPKHTFSGRLTELENQGLIQVTGVEDGHKKYEVKQ